MLLTIRHPGYYLGELRDDTVNVKAKLTLRDQQSVGFGPCPEGQLSEYTRHVRKVLAGAASLFTAQKSAAMAFEISSRSPS